jgi:cold shock CspA family protein/tetratricopeptide (TPR) repeat protein
MPDVTTKYFRGKVQQYDNKTGRGLIRPDEGQDIFGQLMLRSKSLRDPVMQLEANDRVLFSIEIVDRGILATDVHYEMVQERDQLELSERIGGTIREYKEEKGYGFIRLITGQDAFFHITFLSDPDAFPVIGSKVTCRVVTTARGIQGQDIIMEGSALETHPPGVGAPISEQSSQNWLARAIIARDNRNYDEAGKLYEKGFLYAPTVPLILSYASMEKIRRRNRDAMRIYEKGIGLFAEDAKLREDAGILAASMGEYQKALRLLHDSLHLSRNKNQRRGEKGILLALARTYYRIGEFGALQEAIKYYEEAQQIFGRGQTRLPSEDSLSMNIAKIRTQHHRGNLAVQFLRTAKFKIVRAKLLEIRTEGAEFVVAIDDPEFRESYGVAQEILVRCMFKGNVSRADLEEIDEAVKEYEIVDEQVALMIVSSLPEDLQRDLSARIEQRKRLALAIVPIQQSEIETLGEPLVVLRDVLDRWLYRRDLFAGNVPVVGRRFFGRDKALAQIRDAIATSTPTGIYGLRKVGKTSLLRESQRRAMDVGDIVVYLDLLSMPAEISDCRWLYFEIDRRLRQEADRLQITKLAWRLTGPFAEYLDIPLDFPVATAFDSDLKRLLQALRVANFNPKPKVVLLLDEIERLLPTSLGKSDFKGSLDFFSYIRGISQESSDFVTIITGANSLITEAAQFDGRDNPVFNFFNDIYLQFLEDDESDLMMRVLGRGMGIRFEVGAIFYIHNLTGGHPFFTKQLCSFVAERYSERPLKVSKSMVAELVNEYLAVKSSDFEEIIARLQRDYPEELKVCIELAKSGGSMPVERIYNSALDQAQGSTIRHLTGYQIVKIKNNQIFLTIDLLRRWLQKRYTLA